VPTLTLQHASFIGFYWLAEHMERSRFNSNWDPELVRGVSAHIHAKGKIFTWIYRCRYTGVLSPRFIDTISPFRSLLAATIVSQDGIAARLSLPLSFKHRVMRAVLPCHGLAAVEGDWFRLHHHAAKLGILQRVLCRCFCC
jgi:hypothetical protein